MTESSPHTPLRAFLQKIIDRTYQQAMERRGGGWTTGLCVVGKDMQTGLLYAEGVIDRYDFNNGKSEKEQCEELYRAFRHEIENYSGADAEGYVEGTINDFASWVRAYSSDENGQ